MKLAFVPFGCEYCLSKRWSDLERAYVGAFGLVDLPGRLRAKAVKRVLRALRWREMLDFGSGTGAYAFYFSRRSDSVVLGVDIDASRIEDCRAIADRLERRNVKFLGPNPGTAGLKIAAMDVVLAVESLQYVPDQEEVLLDFFRLLRPGGHLIGHVPVLGCLREYETFLFDDDNLRELLRNAGFEIISLTPTFGPGVSFLCRLFTRISASWVLTAAVFPLLLLVSLPFDVRSPRGEYRLFVARKPSP